MPRILLTPIMALILLSSCTPLQIEEHKKEESCSKIANAYAQTISTRSYSNFDQFTLNYMRNATLLPNLSPDEAKSINKIRNEFPQESDAKKKQQDYIFYQGLNSCSNLRNYHANGDSGDLALSPRELALINDYKARIENAYIPKEKALFLKRTEGKTLCNAKLHDFFYNPNIQPSSQCLYAIPPTYMPLRAMQVTPEGVLVTYDAQPTIPGMVIFIYKGNEQENNLVDNARIQPGYFQYAGNYSYNGVLGNSRTVYAFRRVPDPFKGILFYSGY